MSQPSISLKGYCFVSVTLSVLVGFSKPGNLGIFLKSPDAFNFAARRLFCWSSFLALLFPRDRWILTFIKVVWRVSQLRCLVKQTMMKITKKKNPHKPTLLLCFISTCTQKQTHIHNKILFVEVLMSPSSSGLIFFSPLFLI